MNKVDEQTVLQLLQRLGLSPLIVPHDDQVHAIVRVDSQQYLTGQLALLEIDANLTADVNLVEQRKTVETHGTPVALCGRVNDVQALRLNQLGWSYIDRFGNFEIHCSGGNPLVHRNPDPFPDLRPAQMFDELLEREAAGEQIRINPFWSDKPKRAGVVDDSCFSQWYQSPFTIDRVRYETSEQWMMAAKARLMGDPAVEAQIISANSPGHAKALGRQVRWFSEPHWNAEAFEAVVLGNLAKFSNDTELRAHLVATGDKILVEASPVDRLWGVGLGAKDPLIGRPSEWLGGNLLGFSLMIVRSSLGQVA